MSVCEKCNGLGYILKNVDGMCFAKTCDCMARMIADRMSDSSGIEKNDTKVTFRDFETFGESELTIAKSRCVNYSLKFTEIRCDRSNSLLLSGLPGRGKTMLGFAVANSIIKNGIPVLYVSYRDMVTKLKQKIIKEDEYTFEINRLKNIDVLFVDDLFKGKITDSDINIAYELINHRYLHRLPIIVSTEKTQEQLIDIDEAIGSRILEMCKDFIVVLSNSKNYRLR